MSNDEAADPKVDRSPGASQPSVPSHTTTIASLPEHPRGGDPVRRENLRQRIYNRRRNAKALDQWVDRVEGSIDLSTAAEMGRHSMPTPSEPCADWWLDIGMTLGVAEREQAGRAA
jgi:hypothetical protein